MGVKTLINGQIADKKLIGFDTRQGVVRSPRSKVGEGGPQKAPVKQA